MAWARFDDQLHSHPKLAQLDYLQLPCMGLQLLAVCWSNAGLTDGHIPRAQVFKLCGDVELLVPSGKPWPLVDALVHAGLWDECEAHNTGGKTPDCYVIHDFLDYNPSKAAVLAERTDRDAQRRQAGKRSAEVRRERFGTAQPNDPRTGAERSPERSAERFPNPVPGPVPDPKSVSLSTVRDTDGKGVQEIFEVWKTSTKRPTAKLTDDRKAKITARLREGFSKAELISAVQGWANDPWTGRAQQNDLSQLLRNGAAVEKFRDLWVNGKPLDERAAGWARSLDESGIFDPDAIPPPDILRISAARWQ